MQPPDFIRLTLVGRSAFDFEASLHSDKEGKYFSDFLFLKSVAEQRDVQLKKSQAVQAVTAIITLYALFVSVDNPIDVEIFALKLKNLLLFKELLLVIVAVGTFYSITYTLNVLLATRMLQLAFAHVGIRHYRYFLADKSISDLWVSVLDYKVEGYASGTLHRILLLIAAAIMLVAGVALPIASLFVVMRLGSQFIAGNGLLGASGVISALSMLIASASVFYFLISVLLPLKFKFRELPQASAQKAAPPR